MTLTTIKLKRLVFLFLGAAVVSVGFQNCGGGSFQNLIDETSSITQPSSTFADSDEDGHSGGAPSGGSSSQGSSGGSSPTPILPPAGDASFDDGPSSSTALRTVNVASTAQLMQAMQNAIPGDLILLENGTYTFTSQFSIRRPGTIANRIFIKGKNPGMAVIEHCNIVGFKVQAPYWIFEDLVIRGTCPNSGTQNAHAFQIVGEGHHTYIRGCLIYDFQSHVKLNQEMVNGVQVWPNEFRAINSRWTRSHLMSSSLTDPKNMLNIDGGERHQVRGNLFWDLPTANSGQHHSAIYMKAGIRDAVVENNIIICRRNLSSLNTVRGIFSGDQSGSGGICNGSCTNQNMIYRNNIVSGCNANGNSSGIHIANETNSRYEHNLVFGEKWNFVDSRAVVPNYFSNSIVTTAWNGSLGLLPQETQVIRPPMFLRITDLFLNPASGDFTVVNGATFRSKAARSNTSIFDFCGNRRSEITDLGPIDYSHQRSTQCIQHIRNLFQRVSLQ